MLINLKKFLLSDDLVMNINDTLTITDKELLETNKLNKEFLFEGKFYKVDKNVSLNAKITYAYDEVCARCLEEFENKVTANFNAIIVDEINEDYEAEDIEILMKDGLIDLNDAVNQIIYLSMPMKALCKDDCKGICSKCGKNLNTGKCECNDFVIDPRLEKLKTLLED
ncbi:DUF177 domain-containing protein [Sedimentibacter sp. zth1]|uniref:YceD family protein n=1 Tax=Sedimentibacter sp. zth1 TaxID=2816908 RepID=UPI001A937BD3|nr:DUF177 domain-containing protein [Sedimentibacter sp. zth1]QSX06599.1 DUF177 domain-containing protein [Sedimentibacter sp. zth1]